MAAKLRHTEIIKWYVMCQYIIHNYLVLTKGKIIQWQTHTTSNTRHCFIMCRIKTKPQCRMCENSTPHDCHCRTTFSSNKPWLKSLVVFMLPWYIKPWVWKKAYFLFYCDCVALWIWHFVLKLYNNPWTIQVIIKYLILASFYQE